MVLSFSKYHVYLRTVEAILYHSIDNSKELSSELPRCESCCSVGHMANISTSRNSKEKM